MKRKKFKLTYLNDDFQNQKNKIFILCLENYFFNTFILEVKNIINEEDRIEKIEEKLEEIFPKYDSNAFILKYEKIKIFKNREKLIVYLLNLDLLEKNHIINSMKDKKNVKLISIIPSFFKCREFQEYSNFFNFDISKKTITISKYTFNTIEEIISYQINYEIFEENYSSIINTYLQNIENNYEIIFTGEKINSNILMLKNRKFHFYEIKKFDISKAPNFLPENYKNIYTYFYSNLQYLIILLIFSLILLASTLFLNYKIQELENISIDIQIKNSKLEENIENVRKNLSEIEKTKLEIQKKLLKNKSTNLKLTFLLDFLTDISKDIKIKSIEKDKNSILNIIGFSYENRHIIEFIKRIESSKYFELINYDYIINTNNLFEFKIEIKYAYI